MRYQRQRNENQSITGAIIGFYLERWRARYDERAIPTNRLHDNLYVMEFRAAGCDTDELFEVFVEANSALERTAYGLGHERHFGIAYLANNPIQDRGLIRAIVMVEPEAVEAFAATAETLSKWRPGLSVTKCEIDPVDPDAHWRWLAEGIQASIAMFDDGEPLFVTMGRDRAFKSQMRAPLPCRQLRPGGRP